MTTEKFISTFQELQAEQLQIMKQKNADYAGEDPLKCFRLCEELGICSMETGILVRICDKLSRASTLLSQDAQVADEALEDTISDLANYANILGAIRRLDAPRRKDARKQMEAREAIARAVAERYGG